eukprot:g26619.t1
MLQNLPLPANVAKLLQHSYNTGIHPTIWKIDQIGPVHKKHDEPNLANYWPVNLLLIIGKAMEEVGCSTFKWPMQKNNVHTDIQSEFCQGHSAPGLITALVQTWIENPEFQ